MKRKTTKPKNSRQRDWQIKMKEQGRCWRCGDPAIGTLCPKHLKKERERQRKLRGYKKRNRSALSYSL